VHLKEIRSSFSFKRRVKLVRLNLPCYVQGWSREMSNKNLQVWTCKIIVDADNLPNGFDSPPRMAAEKAIEDAGFKVLTNASGWGGTLTDSDIIASDCPNERVVMRVLHAKQHSDVKGLSIELFEMLDNRECPFGCRLVDKETDEVGPQIKTFDLLSRAAKCYEDELLIW
jgi:hypothetical protein